MATLTAERYNGNGTAHGAPLTLTNAGEMERLRHERDAAEARANGAEARAQAARRTLIDMRRVLTQTGWNPAQRIQYAMLQARVENAPGDGPAAILEGGARAWSKQLGRGFGEQTCAANLAALQRAGLIEREERKQKMPDGTVKTVYSGIHVWRTLPAELPATLEDGARRENARTAAETARRMYKTLQALTCPECGTVGEWAITCTACGHALENETAPEAAGETAPDPGRDAVLEAAVTGSGEFNEGGAGATAPLTADGWPDAAGYGRETLPPIQSGPGFLWPGEADAGGLEAASGARALPELRNGRETLPPIAAPEALQHLTGAALTGPEAVEYLAQAGAVFTLAEARSKKAMGAGWPDNPHPAREALAHLKRGGNVGILSGAGGLAVIDVDAHAGDFLRQHPDLASAPLVFRRDAPERVKIIIRLEGEAGKHYAAPDDARRKVEYLAGRHHGIMAGTHASGATIEVRPGEMPTMTGAEARAICVAWADAPPPIIEPPSRAASATGSTATDKAEAWEIGAAAIAWANADADIRRCVDAQLAKLPHSGKYYSLRPDDGTPSATWGKCDAARRLMRDHGRAGAADATMDDFELWARFEYNGDKRAARREAVRLYCAATGKGLPVG